MERIIIDHNHPEYRKMWNGMLQINRYNGAFYYSKEIAANIIPNVETDRNWITVRVEGEGTDHSIVFIHNNLHPERYDYLKEYKDLVLVCGVKETMEKVAHLGTPIYLPLSIDIEYVKRFAIPKEQHKGSAFVGRPIKKTYEGVKLPEDIDILEGIKRQDLLPLMAHYEYIYAVGRTAIEAKALGCKLKAYDPRYPKVSIWKPLDNKDAAKILQKELDKIDGKSKTNKRTPAK